MSQEKPQVDLTTPEAVAAGQEVYDRLHTIRPDDVHAELNAVYGSTPEEGS